MMILLAMLAIAAVFGVVRLAKRGALPLVFAAFALFLVPALSKAAVKYMDGSWFDTACYGCEGDEVIVQVKADMKTYADARAKLYEPGGWTIENLLRASHAALFSYVQSGQLLEVARLYAKKGDLEKALTYYKEAAEAADDAIAMPLNDKFINGKGENVPEKSRSDGAKWKAIADKRIAELSSK